MYVSERNCWSVSAVRMQIVRAYEYYVYMFSLWTMCLYGNVYVENGHSIGLALYQCCCTIHHTNTCIMENATTLAYEKFSRARWQPCYLFSSFSVENEIDDATNSQYTVSSVVNPRKIYVNFAFQTDSLNMELKKLMEVKNNELIYIHELRLLIDFSMLNP